MSDSVNMGTPVYSFKYNLTLEDLKQLIVFAKEQGILKFKYQDFEFDLSQANKFENEIAELRSQVGRLGLAKAYQMEKKVG